MSRSRHLLILFILFLTMAVASEATDEFLVATKYIDSNNPVIIETAKRITAEAKTDREKAVLIHDFVRDEIPFGFTSKLYDQKASEVIRSGMGFCNTKSTLFVALLRAVQIPARQHFVNISTRILDGVIDPGTPFVDHSYAEVWIDGQWYKTDSYAVDLALAEKSKSLLLAEDRMIGYGVHQNGTSKWDGKSDAFSQFLNDGSVNNFTTADHGVFDDVEKFYSSGNGVNKLNFFTRMLFGFFSRSANKRIEGLRN